MPPVNGILRGFPTLRRHKETLVIELISCEVPSLYRKLGRRLATNKNEIMPFTATWRDLKIITLSEVSQTEKDKYYMISLICGI